MNGKYFLPTNKMNSFVVEIVAKEDSVVILINGLDQGSNQQRGRTKSSRMPVN